MTRVIVVGAGIVGLSCAEWLRRDGHAVTLIDRVPPGDPAQTSFGNAGVLASSSLIPVSAPGVLRKLPGYLLARHSPLGLHLASLPRLAPWLWRFLSNSRRERVEAIASALSPLIADSLDQHEALARGTPAAAFIRPSRYNALYRDRAAFERDAWAFALRERLGCPWEEWDRDRLHAHDRQLSPAYGFAASFTGHGYITSPSSYVAALAAHFRRMGGCVLEAEVSDIRPPDAEGSVAVVLKDGTVLDTDRAVLAAGVWSGRLARRLGHDAAMVAERGYHVMLSGASYRPPSPLMAGDAKIAVTPMDDGVRFAGTVEFARTDAPPGRRPPEAIRHAIRRIYPDLAWEEESVWMGQRPSTVDSLPLVGALPAAPSIQFAFGTQHLGMTMGPKLGRLTADLAAGRHTNIDMNPYRVDRFGNRRSLRDPEPGESP